MVDYSVDRNLAILGINNPPVNALSFHVREGLFNGIKQANADRRVEAIVITGKGKTYCSGADIREFSIPSAGKGLVTLGHRIEDSDKPVISAIHGNALGGGLEIALFSHYRVANKNAKIGFPEVLIGLLPGAEGTIRLPRVTGLAFAMDAIASGRRFDAQEAHKHGILDTICDGDVLQEAKAFSKKIIGQPLDQRRLSKTHVKDAADVDIKFEEALAQIKRKYRGLIAPILCLKSVRNSAKMSFDEAAAEEMRLFGELLTSSQSIGLRYSFFAERSAPKWKLPCGACADNTTPVDVKTTGVIGAGTMGSGIAVCLIRAGIPVILVEKNQKMLDQAIKTISRILTGSVKLNRMTEKQREHSLKLLKGASTLDELAGVDMVIEAVYENLELKREIFHQLDKICKSSTLLCSNTSTLDIDNIASATQRPDKVVGTHFFAPAYIMRLLENVYGTKTSPTTVATVMELGKRIGKICVLVKTCYAFVANRTNQPFGAEASFMVEEGALPQDVDTVLENFGMPMGPFKVSDLSGIDVGWRIRQEVAKALGLKLTLETRYRMGERITTLADRLYEMGRYGIKTGKGWYRYEPTNPRKPIPDPDVAKMIQKHCMDMGIERRNIPAQEVIERCLFSAINESFRVLEQRIAEKPEDIDVIWQYGFSFPRYGGGPMFYASQVGLKKVFEKICIFHEQFPYSSHWVPSDLLRKLASHSTEIPMDKWTQFISSSKL
ncbi:peroxisomal bifunctional enzyme [Plakobranchus ocellatus]|uniref:Peroxisomal bifunctional enzyme n=1 Tax=Plakobranchus ocellatus TaxID=259542 RepID=A0AAV4DCU2_9GAST|nr:peroxisomal bifunctional enzyme [Plakobranchus ocellatus]